MLNQQKEIKWSAFSIGGLLLAAIYLSAFVWRSSFLLPDGNRYFCLFDDAMVSMRYALNFIQGKGLVWNPHEYVEGYTNLLQVLVMSLSILFFGKGGAILGMHVLGILTVILVAEFTRRIFLELAGEDAGTSFLNELEKQFLGRSIIVATIAYYPLVFWSVMGMETGMNTLFLLSVAWSSLKYRSHPKAKYLTQAGFSAGLAYVTRPDSIVLSALFFLYLWGCQKEAARVQFWKRHLIRLIPYWLPLISLVAGQLLFRKYYYGVWLPNTYTLKMEGFPLLARLGNGLGFVWPYLLEHLLLIFLAVYGLVKFKRFSSRSLLTVAGLQLLLQIYVGGDAWNYWRMLVPAFPFILIYGVFGGYSLCKKFHRVGIFPCFLLLAMILANFHCLPHQFLVSVPRSVLLNAMDVEVALNLKKILKPNATIAVAMAGAIPYYTELPAIDILGKADAHVAHLPPDLDGGVSWSRMKSVPGHNKYDLNYSIKNLQPDYIQLFSYGKQNLKDYVDDTYDCYWIGQWSYFVRKHSLEVSKLVLMNESALASARNEATLCKANVP